MAKGKGESEDKSEGKNASAAKGSSKPSQASKVSETKPTAKAPSSPTSKTSPGKGKATDSKSGESISKGSAPKVPQPVKQEEKASSKQASAAAAPRRQSATKPAPPAKTPDTFPAEQLPEKRAKEGIAKSTGPESQSAKPAKRGEPGPAPGEAAKSAGPTPPKSEAPARPVTPEPVSPAAQTTKPALAPGAPVAAPSAPAPEATTPAEKVPQWPDVETDSLAGVHLPVAHGKAAVFGGPKDRGGKRDDKLGLPTGAHYQYELVRNLNPKAFYCAMRFEYRQMHMSAEEGKRWWANKRILISANGKSIVAKAVDFGPHENSGFSIGVSPGAAEALGIEPGHEVDVKFADQKTPLGPVS
ncbi:MAG TPA: hypothetical protein VEZ90_10300 [Blastocatellia bacterium]|nr:hypothetical protein [Blastocatellia bacterium]